MTAISASSLVSMCGIPYAFDEDKPYQITFNRLGMSSYVFLCNVKEGWNHPDIAKYWYFMDMYANKLKQVPNIESSFSFEVLENDMEILKNIGQELMPNGYQQFFDILSLHKHDNLNGFVMEIPHEGKVDSSMIADAILDIWDETGRLIGNKELKYGFDYDGLLLLYDFDFASMTDKYYNEFIYAPDKKSIVMQHLGNL